MLRGSNTIMQHVRLCTLETEEHFLLKCAKTNDIRQKMVSDIIGALLQNGIVFQTLSLADKLKTMLSNVLVAKYVANFTFLATGKKNINCLTCNLASPGEDLLYGRASNKVAFQLCKLKGALVTCC